MNSVLVYHVNWDRAGREYLSRPWPEKAMELLDDPTTEIVAEVEYPSNESLEEALEYAYLVTNTIAYPWYEEKRPRLKVHADGPRRSTCVGDLMKIGDLLFLVQPIGFKRLLSFVEQGMVTQ